MSATYDDTLRRIKGIEATLTASHNKLQKVDTKGRPGYRNARYRLWNGDFSDIENFATRLDEWLNQPSAAEAKRRLAALKHMAGQHEYPSLDDIEKDWKFLSVSYQDIGGLSSIVEGIEDPAIKCKTAAWVLERVSEKDVEKAKTWAKNAGEFSVGLTKLGNAKTNSALAAKVRKRLVDHLRADVKSFDKGPTELVSRCYAQITRAENLISNKPDEIAADAVSNTSSENSDVDKWLTNIESLMTQARNTLISIEWLKPTCTYPNGYPKLLQRRRQALGKDTLNDIVESLSEVKKCAEAWEKGLCTEIDAILARCKKMATALKDTDVEARLKGVVTQRESYIQAKDKVIELDVLTKDAQRLEKDLRKQLQRKLNDEDAIALVEQPGLVEDQGRQIGWDIDRFVKALSTVLRNGLIEIRAVERDNDSQ